MANRVPFAPNEWYHCYNRGVDKRIIFQTERDYERFIQTLYLSNSTEPIHQDDLRDWPHEKILQHVRGAPLVAIAAYSLMPNHYHLLLSPLTEKGISKFMHKVGIAYTMYFNIKNERTGNLFMRPFRSKHVQNENYAQYLPQYIHLNAAELFEPGWKKGKINNLAKLEESLRTYPYSSFADYCGNNRPERTLLDPASIELFSHGLPNPSKLITEAAEYYRAIQ